MVRLGALWVLLAYAAGLLTPAFSSFAAEEDVIPKKPTPPPRFEALKHPPKDNFTCPRAYTYKGKTLNCDSHLAWDGENLRPILESNPEAISYLNDYQDTRRSAQNFKYIGSFGLLTALGGYIWSRTAGKDHENLVPIRNILIGSGLGLAGTSFVISLVLIRNNERRLGNAVETYNASKPEHPIELQFSTGISF